MPAKKSAAGITILFFGDIVGRLGRRAITAVLPDYQKRFQPDLIIANAENLAHGKGITAETIEEMSAAGIQCFTSGNDIWRKKEAFELLSKSDLPILRPANYPVGTPGQGERVFTIGAKRLVVINLQGRVFMPDDLDDPFRTLDTILSRYAGETLAGVVVDFHAEATSEKVALGWYADGRVSAVIGTHTHVPTADAWVMPKGTGYITDAGMVGPRDSVIGVRTDIIVRRFLTQLPQQHEIAETGWARVDAVVLVIDPSTGHARSITAAPTSVQVD